jgi:hypothetical protein
MATLALQATSPRAIALHNAPAPPVRTATLPVKSYEFFKSTDILLFLIQVYTAAVKMSKI